MSGLEAVLIVIGGIAFLVGLAYVSYAGHDLVSRRAAARRERLRAEIELQRLTHQAVWQMLAAARERYRPGS